MSMEVRDLALGFVRKVIRSGGSLLVSLPPPVVEVLGLREKERILLIVRDLEQDKAIIEIRKVTSG